MLNDSLRILWDYLIFRLNSKPKGGYDIHSPFVFELYTKVIENSTKNVFFDVVENTRKKLLKDNAVLQADNFGAGSKRKGVRTIGDVVKVNAIPSYYGRLLYRLVDYFKPDTIIELGTSVGVSTMYLAGNKQTQVVSIEGNDQLLFIAQSEISRIGLTNVKFVNGEFSEELPAILQNFKTVDFAFVDGDHSEESTLNYFNLLKSRSTEKTVIVFDDIRWSRGMMRAWETIRNNDEVSVSFDLFRCGIVFFRKGIVKQHFNLRFGPY